MDEKCPQCAGPKLVDRSVVADVHLKEVPDDDEEEDEEHHHGDEEEEDEGGEGYSE